MAATIGGWRGFRRGDPVSSRNLRLRAIAMFVVVLLRVVSGRNALHPSITQRRYTMFKRILTTLILLGMWGALAGCNTIEGAGKDIERGGEATQDAAKNVKKSM